MYQKLEIILLYDKIIKIQKMQKIYKWSNPISFEFIFISITLLR